ncbi:hypothetical protein QFZ42_004150 [Variovorax paradoxus]|nr:hypothetical protein [Variovorax paradoxus]
MEKCSYISLARLAQVRPRWGRPWPKSLEERFWMRTISSGPRLNRHSRFDARLKSGAPCSLANSAASTLPCCLARSADGASRLKMPSISSSFSTSTPRFVWGACASARFNASAKRIRHSLIGQHRTMKGHRKAEALRSSELGCLLEAAQFSTSRETSPRGSGLRASGCGWGTAGRHPSNRSDATAECGRSCHSPIHEHDL